MKIQDQINAAQGAGLGLVSLPPGDFRSEGTILLASDIALIGAGPGLTTIGPVAVRAGSDGRSYRVRLENLYVNGQADYVGVDWRNCTQGIIRNVVIAGFKTGLLLAYSCFYNLIEGVFANGAIDAAEIYSGANQNTFIGGKMSGPIGLNIINSNGTTAIGTSLEGAAGMNFVQRTGETTGTTLQGVRCETPSYGPVWLNGVDGKW